jgi:hypothetical protein
MCRVRHMSDTFRRGPSQGGHSRDSDVLDRRCENALHPISMAAFGYLAMGVNLDWHIYCKDYK